jgi:hypothetical protein
VARKTIRRYLGHGPDPINREGMTFGEWYRATTGDIDCATGYSAWKRGEDPSEYRARRNPLPQLTTGEWVVAGLAGVAAVGVLGYLFFGSVANAAGQAAGQALATGPGIPLAPEGGSASQSLPVGSPIVSSGPQSGTLAQAAALNQQSLSQAQGGTPTSSFPAPLSPEAYYSSTFGS